MDKDNSPASSPLTVNVPLDEFLTLLWGYRKGVELRERAIPGEVIVSCLKALGPRGAEFFHIQEGESKGTDKTYLSTVWQKQYWRTAGERQEARDKQFEIWRILADEVTEAVVEKLGVVLGKAASRQLALDLIDKKQWITIESMGVNCDKLKQVKVPLTTESIEGEEDEIRT